jgi:hypothetical protein
MREPLSIAVAQPPCVPYDVTANAATHAAAVRSARARVAVFPELSMTGYELDAPAIAVDDPRLAPIIEACAETRALALVGAPVEGEAGRSQIAMLAVDGTGATVAYRKIYLGTAEAERFSSCNRAGRTGDRRHRARDSDLNPRATGYEVRSDGSAGEAPPSLRRVVGDWATVSGCPLQAGPRVSTIGGRPVRRWATR